MKPSLETREFTTADLVAAEELRKEAGGNQSLLDWRRLTALSPSGCFVSEWNGETVGTVTTIRHGEDLGWIGNLLVDPAHRRRGVAQQLVKQAVKHLKSQGVKCIKLDAMPHEQALYKKLRFKPQWPLHRWKWSGELEEHAHRVPRDRFLRELEVKDLNRIRDLDRRVFGADRARLLRVLLADSSRSTVWDLYSDLESYGMIRPGADGDHLGPIVSTSEHHAHILVRDLISRSQRKVIFWDIPDANKHAVAIAESLGFEQERPLTRMCLGRDIAAGDPEFQYAISDLATG